MNTSLEKCNKIDYDARDTRDIDKGAFQNILDEYRIKYKAKRTRYREIVDNSSEIEN